MEVYQMEAISVKWSANLADCGALYRSCTLRRVGMRFSRRVAL
jgi:hypothetical protein